MKKQKLLVVSRTTIYHRQAGGVETQLNNLLNALKRYYDITVLTTSLHRKKGMWKIHQKRVYEGVKYIFLKDTIPGEYGYSLYESLFWQIPFKKNFNSLGKDFRKASAKYYAKYFKGKFPIILSQSSSAQDFKITNEKLIVINHGTTLNEIKSRMKSVHSLKDLIRFLFLNTPLLLYEYFVNNPQLFKKACKIVLVSETLKKDFNNQHSKFSSKVTVIPNGIDTKLFKPSIKSNVFTALYFGRIDAEKGVFDFIEFAKKLPTLNFELYGSGPDTQDLKNQIKGLRNIHFFGSVPNTEIAKKLSVSHAFLFFTKRKEGMPMSILEALSSGCVVITTLQSNKLDEKEGYFYVSNLESAEKIIRKLYNNLSDFKKYSKKARDYALNNYSYLVMGKKYNELFENLKKNDS